MLGKLGPRVEEHFSELAGVLLVASDFLRKLEVFKIALCLVMHVHMANFHRLGVFELRVGVRMDQYRLALQGDRRFFLKQIRADLGVGRLNYLLDLGMPIV